MATTPLTPMTAAQITNAIAGYTSGLPKPLTDAQIKARAQGLLDPVVTGITGRLNASAKSGANAISGYTNSLANSLASYGSSAKNIYSGAEQAQAAADAAESGAIRTGGSQLADQLAGKIGQISTAPNVQAAGVGPVTGNATGAANALLGTGSAALDQLIGRGTAAQDYAAKLPGLARSQGASDLRDLGLASQKNIADQVATVEQKLPDLVQALRGQSDTRASNIAATRNDATKYLTSRNDALALGQAKNQATVDVAKIKANEAAWATKVKQNATAAKDAKPNASLSKTVGYVVDSNGNYIPDKNGNPHLLPGYNVNNQGQVVKTATTKNKSTSTPRLTAAQVQKYRGTAYTVAENAHNGFDTTDSKSGAVTHHPPLTEEQAYDEMRKEGIPDAIARQAIKRYYGDRDPATNPNAAGPPAPTHHA